MATADGHWSGYGPSEIVVPKGSPRAKILLLASGGGHLHELLQFRALWASHDHLLLTEDTPLGRSLGDEMNVQVVPHLALGLLHRRGAWAFLKALSANLRATGRAMSGFRPDLVLTTGAGAVFLAAAISRALGARLAFVETLARLSAPSLFGRLVAPLAECTLAHSERVAHALGAGAWHDPFCTGRPRDGIRRGTAVTVGTVMPFPRLVEGVAALHREGFLAEPPFAQVGLGGTVPDAMEGASLLPSRIVQAKLRETDVLFTHGGVGSILEGLRAGCRVIAMPRQLRRGEHYDDHQEDLVADLSRRGLIVMVREAADLPEALEKARRMDASFVDVDWTPMVDHVTQWMAKRLAEGCGHQGRAGARF